MIEQNQFLCALSWVYPSLSIEDVKTLASHSVSKPYARCKHLIEVLIRLSGEDIEQVQRKIIRVSKALDQIKAGDSELICILEPSYPDSLRYGLSKPPLVICVRGEKQLLKLKSLGIVGSRKLTDFTSRWMQSELPSFLNGLEPEALAVISGGAVGVDQLSHRLAVMNQQPTVVVMPVGIFHVYPKSLQQFLGMIGWQPILQVSPFAPWQTVRPSLFHYRNEVLTILSRSLLTVQAERRSGSLLSSQLALSCGRDVGVVPGHPSESSHLGCLDLLSDGARLVRDARDIEDLVG